MSEALKQYRRQAKQAALDLGYEDNVISAIRKAKSESEISRIMLDARHNKWKED